MVITKKYNQKRIELHITELLLRRTNYRLKHGMKTLTFIFIKSLLKPNLACRRMFHLQKAFETAFQEGFMTPLSALHIIWMTLILETSSLIASLFI